MASWLSLAAIPGFKHDKVLFNNSSKSIFVIQVDVGKLQLLKYSFITDSWIKYKIQPLLPEPTFNCHTYTAAAISNEGNEICLCNSNRKMIVFEIKDNNPAKLHIIDHLNEVKNGTWTGTGVMINDKFHVIGGSHHSFRHIAYNTIAQKCEIMHDSASISNLTKMWYGHSIIRIQQKLLIFGGSDHSHFSDYIYEYDLRNNAYQKLEITIPRKMVYVACTSILNGQFVLLFGGTDDNIHSHDDIYVYSVNDETFKISTIKCPEKVQYQAFTANDKEKDKLTTFGFIRQQWKKCEIDAHLFPPEYLIRIISGYYVNEWVHLLSRASGKHHKIYAFDIIHNC